MELEQIDCGVEVEIMKMRCFFTEVFRFEVLFIKEHAARLWEGETESQCEQHKKWEGRNELSDAVIRAI